MRSFTDIFIKHPVLAVVVNLVIVPRGLAGADDAAGATVSEDREFLDHHHDGLLRSRGRDGAGIPHHADRAGRVGDQRGGLSRIHQSRRRQHRDGAFEIEPQQHGGTR
jgi:hypothetical protein